MIYHGKWFYTEIDKVKYKAKVIGVGWTFATIRVYRLWKYGIYLPFIWNSNNSETLDAFNRNNRYDCNRIKMLMTETVKNKGNIKLHSINI